MTCKFLNFTLAGYVIATSEIQAGDGASFFNKKKKKKISLALRVCWVILTQEEVNKDTFK